MLRKKTHPLVILTALPDKVVADKLAYMLVEQRLAACVNIIPHIDSIYFWDGKLMRDQEVKIFIKTSSDCAGGGITPSSSEAST